MVILVLTCFQTGDHQESRNRYRGSKSYLVPKSDMGLFTAGVVSERWGARRVTGCKKARKVSNGDEDRWGGC